MNPEGKQPSKKIFSAIQNIKDAIRAAGIKREGSANYSKIFSLTQLEGLVATNKPDDFNITFVGPTNVEYTESTRGYTAKVSGMFLLTMGDEVESLPMFSIGSDRNDASFALGKALTYGRRYFYLGLLGLGSDDLEPENKSTMKKELLQAINTKMSEDPERAEKLKTAWKSQYKSDLVTKNLTVELLQIVNNQWDKGGQ